MTMLAPNSPAQTAASAIEQTLADLVTCLDDEFQAYLHEDLAQIEAVTLRKQRLLRDLPAPATLVSLGDDMRTSGLSVIALQRLREVSKRSQRNLIVLAPRLQRVKSKLRFLLTAMGGTELYGRDGAGSRSTVSLEKSLRQVHQSA